MIRDKIRELLKKSAEAETDFSLEKPERAEFGDYATNLALVLAKERKENPRKIAEDLIGKIKGNREADIFEKIEIAGPGFINFFLNKDAVLEEFKKLSKLKNLYGEAGYLIAEEIQKDNKKFIEKELGIKFNNWISEEKNLRQKNYFNKILEILKNKNLVYKKQGAFWLKTSQFGDDEDRVIVRTSGEPTYFLSDIAYHFQKIERGYKKIIEIWGADHQGHQKRLFAVKKALDWQVDMEILISQVVTIKKGEEIKKMSKRKGEVILLKDLLAEVGKDAARWFYLQKSLDTHMEFDIELAKKREEKNPVYYVQYGHARMASILRKAKSGKISPPATFTFAEDAEILLIKKILEVFDVLEDAIKDYQVHRILSYIYELVYVFSVFYRDIRVLDSKQERERLFLVKETKKILANLLRLIGVA